MLPQTQQAQQPLAQQTQTQHACSLAIVVSDARALLRAVLAETETTLAVAETTLAVALAVAGTVLRRR